MLGSKIIDEPREPLTSQYYNRNCVRCPRLVRFLKQVRGRHPDYACRPVPSFGALGSRLLIVGLAPGLHGANATGRPFTGDHAGILLFRTLHKYGFSSAPESISGDDLSLQDCAVTNAVKCLPPENKPVAAEVNTCRSFLLNELETVPPKGVILALGKVAHDSVVRSFDLSPGKLRFEHAGEYPVPGGRTLVSSYHCSRYNTQTRRLTPEMFDQVFARVREVFTEQCR
ncbi:MAG TPA: SPO1 DNA polymerase [Gammaproteobacteria bacterium]|nr:SPO1 DNA polymerase [Gammaproteobacteria bacterium]